jgi:uncharacterized repeat protein (TIGR03803 family)
MVPFSRSKRKFLLKSICSRATAVFVAGGLVLLSAALTSAQTFQVLHNFTGGADGNTPNGLAIDRAGNLYGTTGGPGNCVNGGVCGGVFKFARERSGWIFTSLYHFRGGSDGSWPNATVTIAPDGTLYGTTTSGGGGRCSYGGIPGCGTVYHLQPSSHICSSVSCPWNDTILYAFQPIPDVQNPYAEVTLDAAGNVFGTGTFGGGLYLYGGGVYKLTRSQGNWSYDLLHSFNGPDGARVYNPVLLDRAGNIYGTTDLGGENEDGVVFEMSSSGSGWTEDILHTFGPPPDGGGPEGLISDSAGNLYGAAGAGGAHGSGAVFELSPSGSGYTYSVLYDGFYSPVGGGGPRGPLVMDSAGNLYGTTSGTGRYSFGMTFELSPNGTGWTFTDLHDFTGTDDGESPQGILVVDSSGNIYGVTAGGGAYGFGVIWELTP